MRNRRTCSALAAALAALVSASLFPRASSAETDPKTVRLWKAKCASCHGADGKAQTETGTKLQIPDMTTAAFQKKTTDAQMKTAILDGIKREGKPEGMDPFRDKLTPQQVDQLVAYVRTFGK
jgi:mono/diheme cytochrome c family protein